MRKIPKFLSVKVYLQEAVFLLNTDKDESPLRSDAVSAVDFGVYNR